MAADRNAPTTGFKRLNFFKGLIASEQDWSEEEQYRADKRRLHTRFLHGPGVVMGYAGNFAVASRGDLSVEIQPGAAIDGRGNEIISWETTVKNVPSDSKNDQVCYIVVSFVEQGTDFIAYKQNLAIRGHRRMQEGCAIEVTTREPKIDNEVEIARVFLEKGAKYLRDAKDPSNPKPNELDTRAVLHAGVAGSFFDANLRKLTDKMMFTLRGSLRALAKGRVMSAHNAMSALLEAQALHQAGMLDRRNLPDVIWLLVEMLGFIYDDLMTNHAQVFQVKEKELNEYYKQVRSLQPMVWQARASDAAVKTLYLNLQRAGDLIGVIAQGVTTQPPQGATMVKGAAPPRRY
jgi:hypothetical protein